MNWYKRKYANAQVGVDLGDYEEKLRAMLQDVSDRSQDSYTELQNFQPNTTTILNSLQSAQYPNIALVQNAVTSKNQEALHNALKIPPGKDKIKLKSKTINIFFPSSISFEVNEFENTLSK
jgi:hypothetical protein